MPGLRLRRDDAPAPQSEEQQAAPARRGIRLRPDDEEPAEAPPAPAEPADEPGTGEGWLDALIGYEDGQLLGNTANIARVVDRAPELADAVHPALGGAARVTRALVPDWVDELAGLTSSAKETVPGKLGSAAGTAGTAVGLSMLAGPGAASQAAMGAGLSGAEALGESDGDWLAALAAMPAGAALGGAGGAASSRIGVRPTTKQLGKSALIGGGLGAMTSPGDPIGGATRGAVASGLGRAAMGAMPAALGGAVRGVSQLAAAGAGTAAGALAQEPERAYGTAPTMAWGIESVLASGDTGLSPADEQRLAEAMMDGDDDKLISANFALQMKNPGYAARLQRELESLQEEE